jgi:hypothetical protein
MASKIKNKGAKGGTTDRIKPTTGGYKPPATTASPVGLDDPKDIYFPPGTVEYGRTGVKRFGMFVLDDFLEQLQTSAKAIAVYREMSDNDAVIGSMLFAIRMLCRGTRWYVESGEKKPGKNDDDAVEFLESCMNDMQTPWVDVINEALSFLPYGWAVQEIVYKQRVGFEEQDPTKHSNFDDGRMGWRKISLRSQITLFGWQFAEDGSNDAVAMRQLSPPDFKMVDIPLVKCLHYVTDSSKGNPEGRSILRNSVEAWTIRHQLEKIEAIGIERDLVGYPVLYIPGAIMNSEAEADQATLAEYQTLVTGIRRDSSEGAILPSDTVLDMDGKPTGVKQYSLELLTSGGQRSINTSEVIKRYDTKILSTLLADIINLGHDNVGSYALADAKNNVFIMAIEAFLDIICEAFNRQAIPRLFAMNPELRKKIKKLPVLKHDHIKGTDLEVLGNYLKSLKMAGIPIVLTDEMIKYVYNAAELPEAPEDVAAQAKAQIAQQQAVKNPFMQPGQGGPGGQPGGPGGSGKPGEQFQDINPEGPAQSENPNPTGDQTLEPEDLPGNFSFSDPGGYDDFNSKKVRKMELPEDHITTSEALDKRALEILKMSSLIAEKAMRRNL